MCRKPDQYAVLDTVAAITLEMARKYYRKSLLHRILLSYDNGKKYEIDLWVEVNLMAVAWRQLCLMAIANCFAHAGFSQAPASIEEDIGVEFSGCDKLCSQVCSARQPAA
ncbi:hypothetical protein HPB51_006395 [Rhipicephalus microplus]|uniref:Uncharacterized protein n=1 Tax=Rhipicephalus microplus TaxID=6941 RepID=A0A9J6D917_RHIMP|nr:hypothetical protein HPB51_006395 [Rhipicephalus microplus]